MRLASLSVCGSVSLASLSVCGSVRLASLSKCVPCKSFRVSRLVRDVLCRVLCVVFPCVASCAWYGVYLSLRVC